MELLSFTWNADPQLFPGSWIGVRWYGLLFASGFMIGFYVMRKMFRSENVPDEWLDKLLLYVMVGTVLGARLGHVFFYDWAYYKDHLNEILMVWKGGLASHGGAIGIIIACYFYSKRVTHKSLYWILDRLVIPTALGGALIRLGNFFNSEIIGTPSDLPWAVVFERVDMIPRHPSQLYESICYLIIFFLLLYWYWKTDAKTKPGYLLGMFLTLVFSARIVVEFVKENQVAFEEGMNLNMGQWLSIPTVAIGLLLVFTSGNRRKVEA
jgi:prolipoprotein diacylglyceryl transferase